MSELTLLSWNVQKSLHTPATMHHFESLLHRYGVDIAALQEVCRRDDAPPLPSSTLFEHSRMAENFKLSHRRCGVATYSKLPILKAAPYLSGVKELGFATRKSALLTLHRLPNGDTLALLNVHAVNFVPTRHFALEMARLTEWIERHAHLPIIAAGDFNTWNRRRERVLLKLMSRYGLRSVQPPSRHIKSLLGRPLDHIFYRGLTLLETDVPDLPVSDHNPIVATFSFD